MTTSVPVILGSLGTGPCQKNWKNWKCGNKSKMSRQQHYWNAWIVCVKETCCHLISTETVKPSPDTTGAKTEFEILIVNLQKSTRGGGGWKNLLALDFYFVPLDTTSEKIHLIMSINVTVESAGIIMCLAVTWSPL